MYKLNHSNKYKYFKKIGGNPISYADATKGPINESKLIGKGSYGCVYSPPLKCNHPNCVDSKCSTGISKLMNYNAAEKELRIYENLNVDEIDSTLDYHIGAPHLCVPEINEIPDSCDFIEKPLGLLIYENGGLDAYNLFSSIINQPQPLKSNNINIFLKSLKNILLGLKIFHENRIAHFDIKLDNMITGIKNNDFVIDNIKLRLIDFGLSINYNLELNVNNIFNGFNGMIYDLFQWHFINSNLVFTYYPVDFYLVSFLKDKILTEQNYKEFRKYIKKYLKELIKTNNSYYYLTNLYSKPEFSRNEIYFTLINLIKYRPFDKIILRIIQTAESFQFGMIIAEIMYYFPQYKNTFERFLDETKILHYNPFERTPIDQLYERYSSII